MLDAPTAGDRVGVVVLDVGAPGGGVTGVLEQRLEALYRPGRAIAVARGRDVNQLLPTVLRDGEGRQPTDRPGLPGYRGLDASGAKERIEPAAGLCGPGLERRETLSDPLEGRHVRRPARPIERVSPELDPDLPDLPSRAETVGKLDRTVVVSGGPTGRKRAKPEFDGFRLTVAH